MRNLLRIVAVIAVLVAFVLAARFLPLAGYFEMFKTWVRGAGPLGYVIYALVYAVACVALIPASALTVGAGAIFGFAAGTIVVIAGATLGACLAFLLGRTVFRKRVARMTASSPKLAAIDRAIAAEGTRIMLLMRVSGFPPFTWTNYALSVTGVPLATYAWTTFLGIIPGAMAFTWAGAAGAAALTGKANRLVLIVTAVGAIAVSLYIARIAARAIQRAAVEQ
ncbi:MAG: TVP38/TMEM64 family protein [Thermoanaerobaculia bacterium]|nr:TVP38/TMEM64 family protein [Thermoanaerobaculia bacterium]